MAEITRRRCGELLRKLFEILLGAPDGLQARVALERLAGSVQLTEYESGVYESTGTRRFEKIVRFATVDCVKAGWFLKIKGTWFVTDAGRLAHSKYPDPEAFYREAVRLYRAWKLGRSDKSVPASDPVESENIDESISVTFEQAEEQAWAQIEDHLRNMNPFEFQELVAELLRAMSYHVSWISPPGRDKIMAPALCLKYDCKTNQKQFLHVATLASAFWALQSLAQQDQEIKRLFGAFFENDPQLKKLLAVEDGVYSNYLTLLVAYGAVKDNPNVNASLLAYENLGSAQEAIDAMHPRK